MSTTFRNNFIFVKQHSTLPEVKFSITQRMREKYDITDEMMENVAVTFSMRDSETGIYHIANDGGKLITTEGEYINLDESKYTLAYRFKENQTKKSGRYDGEFKLDFLGDYCGKITFPTDSNINIIIGESSTKTTIH
jgi:hypothetical protein